MSTANTAAQSLRIVIIGAGMAGILAAIRLVKSFFRQPECRYILE